jgi:hypothetical protein
LNSWYAGLELGDLGRALLRNAPQR